MHGEIQKSSSTSLYICPQSDKAVRVQGIGRPMLETAVQIGKFRSGEFEGLVCYIVRHIWNASAPYIFRTYKVSES
jgi:hypothetical protein